MSRLDRESDTTKDLCTIRKPIVWHRDEAPFTSLLKDHSDESEDNLEHSRRDDSEWSVALGLWSMTRGRPTVPKARRIKAHKAAWQNVLDAVDWGRLGLHLTWRALSALSFIPFLLLHRYSLVIHSEENIHDVDTRCTSIPVKLLQRSLASSS